MNVNNGGEKASLPVRRLDRYGQNLFSGWSPKNLQFYVLNYENVTCHLTRISHSMTYYDISVKNFGTVRKDTRG